MILLVVVLVLGGLRDRKEDQERALHHRSGQRGERPGVQHQGSAARERGVQHGAVRDQLVLHQLVQSREWNRREKECWGRSDLRLICLSGPQCSAQCGPGVQKREVVCLTRDGVKEGGGGGDCVGEKPAEMKACNGGPCVPITTWYSSPWSQVPAALVDLMFILMKRN